MQGTRKTGRTDLKLKQNKAGYLVARLYKDGKRKDYFAHVIVATVFVSNPDNLPFVNHKRGIKKDNRATELEWITCSDNHKHAFRTGLRKPVRIFGTGSPAAKLTEEQARIIKSSSRSTRDLAKEYGVHHSIIQGIKSGKRWAHITL
jgi:hypothetical protein